MQEFYELKCRPLETENFRQWFEVWYGPESDWPKETKGEYLSERRFALYGWIAANVPNSIRHDNVKFVTYLNEEVKKSSTLADVLIRVRDLERAYAQLTSSLRPTKSESDDSRGSPGG